MPPNISELLARVYLGSTAQPERLTPAKLEERELLKIQILSLGFDLNDDHDFQRWSHAELQELLEALIAAPELTLVTEVAVRGDGLNVMSGPHVPGVNDFMSGALPPRGPSFSKDVASVVFDDPTVSEDTLPRLYRSMPHYMISMKVLKTLDLFSNPIMYELFPGDFFTTVKGLKRAWDEANAAQPDATKDMDEYMFEAVLRRGGAIENAYWGVKYPSDIMPHRGEDGDPEFWREIRERDWNVDERKERDMTENHRRRRQGLL